MRKALDTKDILDATMDDYHEHGIGEPDWDLFDRTENVKHFLMDHLKNLDHQLNPQENKVLVVAHCRIIKSLLAEAVDCTQP